MNMVISGPDVGVIFGSGAAAACRIFHALNIIKDGIHLAGLKHQDALITLPARGLFDAGTGQHRGLDCAGHAGKYLFLN